MTPREEREISHHAAREIVESLDKSREVVNRRWESIEADETTQAEIEEWDAFLEELASRMGSR